MHEAMCAHGMRLMERAALQLQHPRPFATLQMQDEGSQLLPTLSTTVQKKETYFSPDLTTHHFGVGNLYSRRLSLACETCFTGEPVPEVKSL